MTAATVISVPVGHVYVLRDLEAFNSSGAATSVRTILLGAPGAANAMEVKFAAGADFGQWQGRMVMPAGSSLQVVSTGGDAQLILSGYDLEN